MLNGGTLLCTTMSGHLLAVNAAGKLLSQRKDHTKYVVGVTVHHNREVHGGNTLIATAGWDNKVHLYYLASSTISDPDIDLPSPAATITLPTKPEALLFLQHPDTWTPILLLSRTDSNFIYFYDTATPDPRLLGKQNLAPHSNAWVAFTPSALALCPTDPTLLAVGTNSIPHMKLLIVRLRFPPLESSAASSEPPSSTLTPTSLLDDTLVPETQASQARAALALAEREDAAMLIHATTMAPQTAYSTPAVAWRPDGSGVWVNGDDGAVRGIEAKTGKVCRLLCAW